MRNFGKSKGPFGSYPASGNPRLLLLSPASSFSPGVACVRQAVASFSPRCMGWCWAIGRWPVRELRWSHGLQAQFVVDDPDASTSAASFVRELGRKQIELEASFEKLGGGFTHLFREAGPWRRSKRGLSRLLEPICLGFGLGTMKASIRPSVQVLYIFLNFKLYISEDS